MTASELHRRFVGAEKLDGFNVNHINSTKGIRASLSTSVDVNEDLSRISQTVSPAFLQPLRPEAPNEIVGIADFPDIFDVGLRDHRRVIISRGRSLPTGRTARKTYCKDSEHHGKKRQLSIHDSFQIVITETRKSLTTISAPDGTQIPILPEHNTFPTFSRISRTK